MAREILHRCEFCTQGFTTERGFLNHKCKEMVREDEFASVPGQVAWSYYKKWMLLKHKNTVSSATSFKTSKYFNAFYKFTQFTKDTGMPDVDIFITLMVKANIDPKFWTAGGAYRKYLDFITRKIPAQNLAEITIKTMFDLAEAGDVDVANVFTLLMPNEVIQLLSQRRLSPWVLLRSKKFGTFIKEKTSSEERIIMESIINPDYWATRFKKNPKDTEIVEQYIAELGL